MQRKLQRQTSLINWKNLRVVTPLLAFNCCIFWISQFITEQNILILIFTNMMTLCLFIVRDRLNLAFWGVLLQALAIIFSYVLIIISYPNWLYRIVCILLAISGLLMAKKGRELISAGSFVFIPALYLAKETVDSPTDISYWLSIFYMVLGCMPVLIHSLINDYHSGSIYKFPLSTKRNFGDAVTSNVSLIATVLATSITLFLTDYFRIEYGQWLIWSSISVIIALGDEKKKLLQRTHGAIWGVMLGMIAFQFLPLNSLLYPTSCVLIFITLVMFNNYFVAFTARCLFITLALLAIDLNHPPVIRILWVSLGGLIGYFCKRSIDVINKSLLSMK